MLKAHQQTLAVEQLADYDAHLFDCSCFALSCRWNDTAITSLNHFPLPNHPIQLVLQSESITFMQDFTEALQQADPVGFTIAPSNKPAWPTARYAKWTAVAAIDGPPSFVLANPYTLGIALVGVSTQLQASIASLLNDAGMVVQPTVITISAAFREKGVFARRGGAGEKFVSYTWSGNLVSADGPLAWPFTQATSLVIPKTFARQGCRAKSELAKFIMWMLRSDRSLQQHQPPATQPNSKQTEPAAHFSPAFFLSCLSFLCSSLFVCVAASVPPSVTARV